MAHFPKNMFSIWLSHHQIPCSRNPPRQGLERPGPQAMTGDDKHTIHNNGDWGMVYGIDCLPIFWWWIWWNGNLKCWLDNFYWMKNLSSSPFCWLNNDFKWLNPRQTTPSSLTQQVPLVPAILGWPTHLSHPWSKKSSFVHTPGCHQTWGNRRMFPLMITSGIFSASCHGWQFCHGFYDATDERVVICSVNYPDKKVTRSPVESGWIRLWNRFHP